MFTDNTGAVVSSIVVPTLSNKCEAGMYLIADVPAGATALHFSILNTAEFDKVVPVSYTHLDVYKRQDLYLRPPVRQRRREGREYRPESENHRPGEARDTAEAFQTQ